MREKLNYHIKAVLEGIRHLSVDDAADLIAEIADEIAEGGPDDLFNCAILDGIRWSHSAAVQVEMGGGPMLRGGPPDGMTTAERIAAVKAELEALHPAHVTATNAGEDAA